MQIIVATKESQGQRKNDFCFCQEGEIVRFGFECDGEDIDGNCGCRRSMIGIETDKATTTMKVVNLDITKELIQDKFRDNYKKGGWYKLFGKRAERLIKEEIKTLLDCSDSFQVGDILEKRGNSFEKRKVI